jgi:hypothetical protein
LRCVVEGEVDWFVCLFVVSGGLVIEVLCCGVGSVVDSSGVEGETGEDNS